MPKVSIVLPTYNGEKFIGESIDSILGQTFTDWELIIVNDCSTDGTPNIVNRYAASDSRIRVIHNKENQKLPESLNIGFREARGEYLTWTSDDNYYLPIALERMDVFLDENKDCTMVVANMDLIDDLGRIAGTFVSYNRELMFYNDCVGACFMYRNATKEKVGEYDPDWFLVEDYEYWLRILFLEGNIGHINETLYRYRYHNDSLTGSRITEVKNQLMKLRKKHIKAICDGLSQNLGLLTNVFIEMMQKEPYGDYTEAFFDVFPALRIVREFDVDKPTVIYGAGAWGDKAYKLLKNQACYYVDKDVSKIDTLKNGLRIVSLEEFMKDTNDKQLVVAISSESVGHVIKELWGKGIRECCLVQFIG